MENTIAFYYNIHPDNIILDNNVYKFSYNNTNYMFQIFNRPISDAEALYNLNKNMLELDLMVHKIILNNQNKIITYVEGVPYVLLEINMDNNSKIMIKDICYINNKTININIDKVISRYDWINLWKTKNDYFEMQINEIANKYYNLCNYINYYIGMAENAITYVQEALKIDSDSYISVSHKRIIDNETIESLYNPINFIYDFRVRDAAEYIKNAFFNNEDSYKLLREYLLNNFLSIKEVMLFYGRLLYPSYFFDLYDDIVNNNLEEIKINKIVSKSEEYEEFLKESYIYISKLYNTYFPKINWIIKKRD